MKSLLNEQNSSIWKKASLEKFIVGCRLGVLQQTLIELNHIPSYINKTSIPSNTN